MNIQSLSLSFLAPSYVSSDHEWCCKITRDYPDLIPTDSWGSFVDVQKQAEWNKRACSILVGGGSKSKCKGKEFLI